MKSMIFWSAVVIYFLVSKMADMSWNTWLNGFAAGSIAAYWALRLALYLKEREA